MSGPPPPTAPLLLERKNPALLLAQLTDTHVFDPDNSSDFFVDNNARLAAAVAAINAESVRPDAVIATGDLTDTGSATEMSLLAQLLAPLEVPLLPLPGNHDRRDSFRATFDMPWATTGSHLGWVFALDDLNVIGVDTLLPGSHGGLFDAERAAWLDQTLRDHPNRPAIIAMHHPPFASGILWMDEMGLEGRDRFAEVVAGHDHVVRILCGHLHRPMTTTVGGVTTTVGLAPVHHVQLNLDPTAPIELILDPVGYQLHNFDGHNWVTHTRHIATGSQPFQPDWT